MVRLERSYVDDRLLDLNGILVELPYANGLTPPRLYATGIRIRSQINIQEFKSTYLQVLGSL
jgi:hypothetical protein